MTRAMLSLLAGVVALVTTRVLLRGMIPNAPLRRQNYRGIPVASGMGIVPIAGFLAGTAFAGLLFTLDPHSRLLGSAAVHAVPLAGLAVGFGLIGLFDDLSEEPERGFRGHLTAAREGRATSGALKLFAGAAIAVTIAAPESTNFGWALAHGALIALTANLFNGLDVRPGRGSKAFLLAALPLVIVASKTGSATIAAAIGAVVAFLPADLRERAMLGDAGANALGALVGGAIVYAEPVWWLRLGLLALVAGLTVVAERPGFSVGIDALPPLRALDRAGRVPDGETKPAQSSAERT